MTEIWSTMTESAKSQAQAASASKFTRYYTLRPSSDNLKPMFRSCSRMILNVAVVCSLILSATAGEQSSEPNIDELIRAGESTVKRIRSTPASWTVKYRFPSGTPFEVKVVRNGEERAWTFFSKISSQGELAARIVQTGGIWSVMDLDGSRSKWRPYEAELRLPAGYMFLSLSDLRCVVDRKQFDSARFEKRDGNVVHYRLPLSEKLRRVLQQVINELVEMASKDAALMGRPQFADGLKSSREQLEQGVPLGIDERTGIVVQSQVQGMLVSVEQFEWLDKPPREAFELPANAEWNDETKPLSASDLSDCLMVGHDSSCRDPKDLVPDGYLLNLKTGHLRRLPFRGFTSMPGGFLQDRQEVVICGFDTTGEKRAVKVNLLTGENTAVEYGTFEGGPVAMTALSPDGKKIASVHSFSSGKLPDIQIRLIDLQTGESQPLGKPTRIDAPLSWLPDGDGLIYKRFVRQDDPKAIEPQIVCRLGLDGKMTDLRAGEWPVVLRKSRRILYQDEDSRLWYTCELDGTKPELFAGGFKDYRTPAVSPDEKRIVFVRYEKGKTPQLTLFEMGKTEGKPAVQAGGFIGMPVWR
jgi:WD40-like Beta Propeller Repeat